MNIVLRSSPLAEPTQRGEIDPARLVMLDCYGRGAFANRTIYLASHSPLDYRGTQVEQTKPIAESNHLKKAEEAILKMLKKGPCPSATLLGEPGYRPGTIRNGLTSLRKKGRIKVICIGNNPRLYALADGASEPKVVQLESETPSENPSESPDLIQKVNVL